MGDDLIFAQKFTRTAADGLALLVKMDDPRAVPEASVVIDMMTSMQRGAKRLRARHIYTGAQGVLSALHHEDDETLEGRIDGLGCLVTQYARGLGELVPAQTPMAEKTRPEKWDAARETLNDLLPMASAGDADLLSRLMRAPVTLATVHPHKNYETINAEIVAFDSIETAQAPLKTQTETPVFTAEAAPIAAPVAETASAPRVQAEPIISMDAMMRDVIADALSVARTIERTISLSYDMGERSITVERAEDLRGRLGQALSQIIRQSLSDDRVGHIDVNLAGEQLHIMAGTTALRVAIHPNAAPKPKKLITPETEPGLRSQLNALMDPVNLHETAS